MNYLLQYFHTGRHRAGYFPGWKSVTTLTKKCRKPAGWKVSANGKYLYSEGMIHFPNTWGQRGFITMDPPDGLISLPALVEDK